MPQIKSILCPVDFSEFSVNAYEYAQSLAWHYKATLFLQHVLYSLQPLGFGTFIRILMKNAVRSSALALSRSFRNLRIATRGPRFGPNASCKMARCRI